jgi:actin related protein 2/3 complex subunit 2
VNIDQTVSDFDGVTFHISTPETKTKILVSISVKCYNELLQYGAQQVLEREYGPYVVEPESGYNFSVQVDLESLPEEKGMDWSTWDRILADTYFQRNEMI